MPFRTKEQRKAYMKKYMKKRRKEHRSEPTTTNTFANTEDELAQLLGCTKEEIQNRMHGKYSHLNLTPEELRIVEKSFGIEQPKDCTKHIPKKFLNEVSHCQHCETNPVVIIEYKGERQGLCTDHWTVLSNSNVGW